MAKRRKASRKQLAALAKGRRIAAANRKANRRAGKKRRVSGYKRKQKKCRVKTVSVPAYRSYEKRSRRRGRKSNPTKRRRRGNCRTVCKPLTQAQRTARRRAAGRKAARTRAKKREIEADRERHIRQDAGERRGRRRRRRKGRRRNPIRKGRTLTKKQRAALAKGRRKANRNRRKSGSTRRRVSGRRRSTGRRRYVSPKRRAAGRKAAATRKRRKQAEALRGAERRPRRRRRSMRRRHTHRRRSGRRENPFSPGEMLIAALTGLTGFAAADVLDRYVATHAITASATTTTNAQGQAITTYTDTPNTTGQYVGLFNGTAVVAPMDWQRWVAGGVLTLVPLGLAFWPVKGTSPHLRSGLQAFGLGAGARWLGKGLQDLVSALFSYTCFGQRLYDPEIRGRALMAVNGNTADATVSSFPSTGLGRARAHGIFQPAAPQRGPLFTPVRPGVGRAPACTGCGRPRTGMAGCCSISGCCGPALPAATVPGQPPAVSAPPGQQPFTPAVPPTGISGAPRLREHNILDWGDDRRGASVEAYQ